MKIKLYPVACTLLVAWIAYLYVPILWNFKDLCSETTCNFLALQHMVDAKETGKNLVDFFRTDPRFENYKKEDPICAYSPYPKNFMLEYQALVCPISHLAALPFLSIFGLRPIAIIAFALAFSIPTIFLVWKIGKIYFGKWVGLFAGWLLATNLIWLIHSRVAYVNEYIGVFLLVLMAYYLLQYINKPETITFCKACGAGGLVLSTGWVCITYLPFLIGLALFFGWRERKELPLQDAIAGVVSGIASFSAVFVLFVCLFNCTFSQLWTGWFYPIFMRYGDPAIGGWNPTMIEKVLYAIKCFWLDGGQIDHLDKCLPGVPGVPVVFSAFFLLGLVELFRSWSRVKAFLLVWLLVGNFFVIFLMVYAHRYALCYLPCIAIIAAQGIHLLYRWFGRKTAFGLMAVLLVWCGYTGATIKNDFYVTYKTHKPWDFEEARMRGFDGLATWLKEMNPEPRNVLVVLGEAGITSSLNFMFYTFDTKFPFVYWANRYDKINTKEDLIAWELEQIKTYKRIVYVFADTTFSVNGRQICNDSLLMLAHPNIARQYTYTYDGRMTMWTYIVDKNNQ